jgi:hypothetical protein
LYRREKLAAKTKSWIQQNPKAPDTKFQSRRDISGIQECRKNK